MSYSNPRDRLELRLKEIIDNTILDSADRRTRFDAFLAAIVDPELAPGADRNRIEMYLEELTGRAGGGLNLQAKTVFLGASAPGTIYPSQGYDGLSQVTISPASILPIWIRRGRTVCGVAGTYDGIIPEGSTNISANGTYDVSDKQYAVVNVPGGSAVLQAKTVALGSSAPAAVSADAGYDGLSTVSFTTSGIAASDIRSGATILGIAGTYAGGSTLQVDSRMLTANVSIPVNLGWTPDRLIVSYTFSTIDEDDPSVVHIISHRYDLTADGSLDEADNRVVFTSTGYTISLLATSFGDVPDQWSQITVTAIKLS